MFKIEIRLVNRKTKLFKREIRLVNRKTKVLKGKQAGLLENQDV